MKLRRSTLAVGLSFASSLAFAQEFRATISGHVFDPSGAAIPNAAVTVTNQDTGVSTNTKTNDTGEYTAPFLLPGKYKVTATAQGFKTYTQQGITVQTSDRLGIDLSLPLGSAGEEVTITADSTLLQTETATAGQVLTAEEIENLPDNGRSPLQLAKTEYGVIPKQKNSVVQGRPFDNSAVSDFSIGGGNSQSNEYLLNGVPNSQDSSRVPGFSPLQDSVQEVRTDVFESDASYGDTSGGTVNITTKAGTNRYHGAISEFNQFSAINAPNRWFSNGAPQAATRQNQYGAYFSGPVFIPKLYNGHDRLFFAYAFEKFVGTTPNPVTTSVPTQAERNGDFSALLSVGKTITGRNCTAAPLVSYNQYQLFDPNSARPDPNCAGQYLRTPYANNIITQKANSVALGYLNFFPLPNGAPTATADGENNFFSNIPTRNDYNSQAGRIDYTLSANNKFFFETHRSEFFKSQNNIFQNIATGSSTYNVYQGGLLDYVHSFSATATLDARLSLTRAYNNSTLPSAGFDPTSLGFPVYLNSNALQVLPRISFTEQGTSNAPAFSTLSTQPGTQNAFDTIQFFAAFTKVLGKHTVKIGPDSRLNKNSTYSPGYSSGNFGFSNNFNAAGTNIAGPTFGGSFASFLLGYPVSGSYSIAPRLQYNNWYHAGFIQDDWKVTRHLTVNLGFRAETETSITESQNRAIIGFDPTITNSATTQAKLNYASRPSALLPAANFNPAGGVVFASASNRNEYNTPLAYVSPRIGLSYAPPALHDRMVVRAGFGIFVNPFNDYYTPQSYGYTSTSTLVATTNNYQSPAVSLSDPFPTTNAITQPTGSTLGANTFLGQGITYRPKNLQVPYSERWTMDMQFQLAKNLMLDVGYLGNHQVHLSYSNCVSCINQVPFLIRSPARDTNAQGALTASVSNPFRGLPNVTSTLATASTVSAWSLLQNYPQYSSVTEQLVPGSASTFNELLVRLQKRVSHGLTINVNYEYSKQLSTAQLNSGDVLTYQENASDFPQHLAVTVVYALPFGRGKDFLSTSPRWLDELIGGFTVNTIYQGLSGAPISWGNVLFSNGTSYNNGLKISARNLGSSFDRSLFSVDPNLQPTSYNYRTFPQFYGRQDATNNLDASILKDFSAGERFRIQYRFEAFNVMNHTQFSAPNVSPTSATFGTITSQFNSPRVLQQGLRVVF